MSRRCLVLGIALLLPGVGAQAETNRYQQIAAERQAGAVPASYLETRVMPAELPPNLAASANPIQQVGFHHGHGGYGGYGGGYGGGCASCGGGGTGFVGECCESMPSCARGVWDSYCSDKAHWHSRMHGCGRGCGHGCGRGGCGRGCGGCCFLPARGAPSMVACGGSCGTFGHGHHGHGRFRGAYMSGGDCGCGAEPSCGCAAGGAAPAAGLAPLPSQIMPPPEAAAQRGTFGNWAATRFPNAMSSPSRGGFAR
jgi:hypothetical protein